MSATFRFKQFSLVQGKAAFKLGTDSVVLASWLPEGSYKRILDLGTGTGILSLMMAQRFSMADIIALEIDEPSAEDCAINFAQSNWNKRLNIIQDDAASWSKKNSSEKFDLIISNPPYYNNSLKNTDERKSIARHVEKLNTETIIGFIKTHLSEAGRFAFILPVNEFNRLSKILQDNGFFPTHICIISSFKNTEVIRKMGVLSLGENETSEEQQYLYNPDKTRSAWYKEISKEFYIK